MVLYLNFWDMFRIDNLIIVMFKVFNNLKEGFLICIIFFKKNIAVCSFETVKLLNLIFFFIYTITYYSQLCMCSFLYFLSACLNLFILSY